MRKNEGRITHKIPQHIQQCPDVRCAFINNLISRDEQVCHELDNNVWKYISGQDVSYYLQKKAQNRNEV